MFIDSIYEGWPIANIFWEKRSQRIHTIRILVVDAINNAVVARTSFPASGFAYK